MAIARCPHCGVPLTRDEAEGRKCQACKSKFSRSKPADEANAERKVGGDTQPFGDEDKLLRNLPKFPSGTSPEVLPPQAPNRARSEAKFGAIGALFGMIVGFMLFGMPIRLDARTLGTCLGFLLTGTIIGWIVGSVRDYFMTSFDEKNRREWERREEENREWKPIQRVLDDKK